MISKRGFFQTLGWKADLYLARRKRVKSEAAELGNESYSVGDRVACVRESAYLREYHGVGVGVLGTVSSEPDGEPGEPPNGMLVRWDTSSKDVRCMFYEVRKT